MLKFLTRSSSLGKIKIMKLSMFLISMKFLQTLIHEAQHLKLLLQTKRQWDDLDDIPNGLTLEPHELLKEALLKPQDRSRNAENWAL